MPVFDPADPRLAQAPDELWRAIRRCPEPVPAGTGAIALWRHASVLAQLRPGPAEATKCPARALAAFPPGRFRDHNAATMAFLDPPRHTGVRRAFARPLAPAMVASLAPIIEATSRELLEAVTGPADLVSAYAERLTLRVIALILDVPASAEAMLRAAARAVVQGLEPGASPAALAAADRAVETLDSLIGDPPALKAPGAAAPRGLAPEVLRHNLIFLLNAGHETTTRLIAGLAVRLLEAPALARMALAPGGAEALVEEQLRLDPPLAFVPRYLAQPMAGWPAGTRVFLLIAAANRDPAVFPDPDSFRPGRGNAAAHLAFLAGRHLCLGASLARLEASIAVRHLAGWLNEWRADGQARRVDGRIFQGVGALPVRRAC